MNAVETLRDRLAALGPVRLDIRDNSHRHAGAREGGHYAVAIVALRFAGLGIMQRHRLVYDALGDLKACGIHALSITAKTPEEMQT